MLCRRGMVSLSNPGLLVRGRFVSDDQKQTKWTLKIKRENERVLRDMINVHLRAFKVTDGAVQMVQHTSVWPRNSRRDDL